MKIAIAQINPIIGDFEYNFDRIKDFSEKAVALSCDLVVFPELVVSGYPPRDLLERNDFIEANLACLN
ncbi:MAG TPA: nitrilase-related carbon-nitrogen hydrolase, partial [Desulfobacterales bacterium]|nr:nitrilase-related carbon-nitrogen hydrolase [Desulfobacterales bacterium]